MRYITRRQTPTDYIALSNVDRALFQCLDMEYFTCNNSHSTEEARMLFYLKNDVDLSILNVNYLESFDFKEISAEDALKLVRETHSANTVSIDQDGRFILAGDLPDGTIVDFTDKSRKPYVDAVWDSARGVWTLPTEKLNDINFSSRWDESTKKWISKCNINESRFLRTFRLWAVKPVDADSKFSGACSSNEYMIESIEKATHGVDTVHSIVTKTREDGIVEYPTIKRHFTLLDLEPIARITYQEFDPSDSDMFEQVAKIHPQCGGRTIQELFRLIIEWAWSYTELRNNEPMAKLCHEVLRVVQMPLDVRQELLDLRPQYVARYVSNDVNALSGYPEDVECPPLFSTWISDMYYTYRARVTSAPLNVNTDTLKESYPR